MKTTLPSPTQRQAQLQRQQRDRDAFRLIEKLATLRDHWQPEDAPWATVEALAEQWHAINVTPDDIDALLDWPQLPLTLGGLVNDISQQIENAWSWHLAA
jgi:hypothetical protein